MTRDEAEAKLRWFVTRNVVLAKAHEAAEVTVAITEAAEAWLRWLGAVKVQSEAPQVFYTRLGKRCDGRLDLLGTWTDGRRFAVEIDHADKEGSFDKLKAAQCEGAKALWVRWDSHRMTDVLGVPVVNVARAARTYREPKPRLKRGKKVHPKNPRAWLFDE